jgi:cell division protein FtsZ
MTLHEINEAVTVVVDAAGHEANVIFGAVIDELLGDEVRVTVIATGFDGRYRRERRERPEEREARPREGAPSGFEVPADVLEVPAFLREDT